MGENDNRTTGAAAGRGIEARLDALEQHIRSVGDGNREIETLREAVEDLAADTLDLHNQMEKLVSSCERLLAGAGDDVELSAGRRNGLRGSASALRRVTGRAVRGTLGAARRFMSPRRSAGEEGRDLEIRLTAPVRRAPRLAVIVRVADEAGSLSVPAELRAQSEPDLEVVLWNRDEGRAVLHAAGAEPTAFNAPDRGSVAEVLAAEFVTEMSLPLPRLHPTIFEICRWTVASEGLPLIIDGLGPPTASGRGWSLGPVDRWVATGDGDDSPPSGLTKVVGGRWWHPAGCAGASMIGAGGGRGYLPSPGSTGSVVHDLAPLDGVVASAGGEGERPTVLVTSTARGAGVAAWLVRALGGDHRFIVAMTEPGATGDPATRALVELGGPVYPLADFLDPAVVPSVVADIIRANRIRRVVRIDSPTGIGGPGEHPPKIIDLPFHRDEIDRGATVVLALGRDIAERAEKLGLETTELVAAPDLQKRMPDPAGLAGLRSAYGVPEDARLVLSIGDLTPDRRPEDVAAVARRLRHRDDVHVLLVGQGPLAGTVSDMAGYFGLDRFTLSPPGHGLVELVAACDCVLSTAEENPWPAAVAAGLALGRSVVATEIDGVRELVAAADGDRCALCPPGDVDRLAAAVEDALDNNRRPMVTKKAWNASAVRSRGCLEVFREALGPGTVDGSENR